MKTYFYFLIFGLILANGSAQNQIQNKPTAASPAGDDWLMLSGDTNGIRKLSPGYYLTTAASAGFQPADSDLNTWAAITPGAGIAAMLAVNVGSAGAPVLFGGAAGTPSSLILTNATGLPLTGLSQSGATTDQVPKWSGSAWVPGTITTGVSSVNGQTGAVTVKPLTTYAAFASNAVTLGHDGIVYQGSPVATVPLTLSSGGSAGDERSYEFYFDTAQTVSTDFAVYRNWATTSANINKSYVGKVTIVIRNMGSGEYRWYDNDFTAADLPAGALANGMTGTTQSPGDNSTKLATTAYTDAAVVAGGGGSGLSIGSLLGWPTASVGSIPTNYLVADGTNGTINAGTFGSGSVGTWIQLGNGTAATPSASPAGGSYGSTQNVTLTSATSGASIYYTTNGATPTTSDTLYSTPVSVAATATLKAKAYKSLYAASAVLTESYVIGGGYVYENELVYANSGAATSDGWTGDGDFVYTGSTITGFAKSFQLTWGEYTSRTFAATADVSICVKLKAVSVGAACKVVEITDGTNFLAWVKLKTGGVVTFGHGPTEGGSSDSTYSTATDYWLWIDRVKSTGVMSFYLSTTGTKPGSPTATTTSAFTSTDATVIYLMCDNNGEVLFNDLFIKSTPIGSNP